MPVYYEAVGNYDGQDASELSFPKGAVLELVQSNEQTGWHRMKFDGKTGNVLMAYLQPYRSVSAAPSLPPRRPSAFARMRSSDNEEQAPIKGKALKIDKKTEERAARASIDGNFAEEEAEAPTYVGPDMLKAGLIYHVQYLGSARIEKSLRDFSNEDRKHLLLEIVNICCERTGLSPAEKMPAKRETHAFVQETLGVTYIVRKKGCGGRNTDAEMFISINEIRLAQYKTKDILEAFPLLDISVMTGGSQWFPNCVAFVARTPDGLRTCHVVECGKYAKTVLLAISEARRLRDQAAKVAEKK